MFVFIFTRYMLFTNRPISYMGFINQGTSLASNKSQILKRTIK